jgi:4-amino-4-deoxy-L-arabinose transferase-like glycosyltransferase
MPILTAGAFRNRFATVTLRDVLKNDDFQLPRGVLLALWICALAVLIAGLGAPVVQRTQEARVLETAREMLGASDWHQWMIPVLNGEPRLQKPPLAYWAAAGGFKLFGVNEFGGRFPFAVAGWLVLALSYQFGRKLIHESAGLFAAAILLSSFMFFRHFRLAETDALAKIFVTAAI